MSDSNYFALLEACPKPGCPVCRLVRETAEHFLDGLFYEMVNDAGMRRQLRRSLGFCKDHVRVLLDTHLRDPLGLTNIYHDMLDKILSDLLLASLPKPETGVFETSRGHLPKNLARQVESLRQSLSPYERCPACRLQEQSISLSIELLVNNLEDETLYQALGASDGLCLPHLLRALEQIQTEDQFVKLVTTSVSKIRILRDELAEFLRKSDYRFSKEGFGEKGNAYKRVMELLIGNE
jgi:hypothetical protein